MSERTSLAIILAAGEGTRMKSATAKVLHPIGGLPMFQHVLNTAIAAGSTKRAVVIGPNADAVRDAIIESDPEAAVYVQEDRLGTGHATMMARQSIEDGVDDVVVLFGADPLITTKSIEKSRRLLADGADLVVIGFEAADPTGYGRLVVENDQVTAIREHKVANEKERRITLCNSGVMTISGRHCLKLLDAIDNDNVQNEYLLTDAVEIANSQGLKVVAAVVDEDEVMGVNDRVQLADVERIFQDRRRRELMLSGVTMIAPDTVTLCHDTKIGRDTVIEPNVYFGPGVIVEDGVVIHSFSYLENCRVASGAMIGPFARLRPGADIRERAKVGNFCEVKKSTVGEGAKVNHLTYIGDTSIGERANIGAGTITCNYDGFNKMRTDIGAGAFIGSNTSLVAPVTIGAGSYVGSGSVVTKNVDADALAVARGRQVQKDGWAAAFRRRNAKDQP